jgi:hypothetical protein
MISKKRDTMLELLERADLEGFCGRQMVSDLRNMGDAVIGVLPELTMMDDEYDEVMDDKVRVDTVTIIIKPEQQMSFFALASSWKPGFIGMRFKEEWTEVVVSWNPIYF